MGMKPVTETELANRIQSCIDRLAELQDLWGKAKTEKERKKIELSIEMERDFMDTLGATPTVESAE